MTEATSDVQVDELGGRAHRTLASRSRRCRRVTARLSRLPSSVAAGDRDVGRNGGAGRQRRRLWRRPARRAGGHADQSARYADAPLVIFPIVSGALSMTSLRIVTAWRGLAPRVGQEAIQMQTIVSLVSAGGRRSGAAIRPLTAPHWCRVPAAVRSGRRIQTGLVWRTDEVSPVGRSSSRSCGLMSPLAARPLCRVFNLGSPRNAWRAAPSKHGAGRCAIRRPPPEIIRKPCF